MDKERERPLTSQGRQIGRMRAISIPRAEADVEKPEPKIAGVANAGASKGAVGRTMSGTGGMLREKGANIPNYGGYREDAMRRNREGAAKMKDVARRVGERVVRGTGNGQGTKGLGPVSQAPVLEPVRRAVKGAMEAVASAPRKLHESVTAWQKAHPRKPVNLEDREGADYWLTGGPLRDVTWPIFDSVARMGQKSKPPAPAGPNNPAKADNTRMGVRVPEEGGRGGRRYATGESAPKGGTDFPKRLRRALRME